MCEECKRPASLDDEYLASIGYPKGQDSGIMEAVGCQKCRETGYRGRMSILEICIVSPEMQEMIIGRAKVPLMKEQALKDGMVALRDDGWSKVALGLTTIEEVLTNTATDGAQ